MLIYIHISIFVCLGDDKNNLHRPYLLTETGPTSIEFRVWIINYIHKTGWPNYSLYVSKRDLICQRGAVQQLNCVWHRITSKWRRFDVITTSLLRNVSAGHVGQLQWGLNKMADILPHFLFILFSENGFIVIEMSLKHILKVQHGPSTRRICSPLCFYWPTVQNLIIPNGIHACC